MKILVTGATGFLGRKLLASLQQKRESRITSLGSRDCDLTDASSLPRLSATKYDLIFHLAAWTQAGEFCLHHPGEQWVINQRINTNVLAWWHEHQSQAKLVCIGTSCAYDEDLPMSEANYLLGTPTPSLFTYAMTKRIMYVGLLALQKQFAHRYLHVVPSTLFGPGYHTEGRQLHFIFDLIRKILRGKILGEPVILWGDGHQRRELVFADDFVEVLLQLVPRYENETINIGTGQDFSIREFARRICDAVGYDFDRIQFDTSRYVGARAKCLIADKLRGLLPEVRFVDLGEGLARTIQWMQEHPEAFLKPTSP
jgi:GDP-L-fucose synthase